MRNVSEIGRVSFLKVFSCIKQLLGVASKIFWTEDRCRGYWTCFCWQIQGSCLPFRKVNSKAAKPHFIKWRIDLCKVAL